MVLTMKTLLGIILSFVLAVPAIASDVALPQSPLYPYQNSLQIQEDFIGGAAASGQIGAIGFGSTGTVAYQASIANRFGILRIDTSAVSGTLARISLYNSGVLFDTSLPHMVVWLTRLNTNDANTTVRQGLQNTAIANPPNEGIYFEKLDADTNWFCVTRAASSQTRVDSTVAVNTSFNSFRYSRNASGVQFSINGVNVCGLMTATIPTVFNTPTVFIINSAAAAKTIDVDYFEFRIFGLVR